MSEDLNKLAASAPGLTTLDIGGAERLPFETFRAVIIDHFRRNTLAYLTGSVLFLSANLGAVYENFADVTPTAMHGLGWWQVGAIVAKSLNAGCIAVLGYLMQSPLSVPTKTEPAKAGES